MDEDIRKGVVVALDLSSRKGWAFSMDPDTGEVLRDGEYALTESGLSRLVKGLDAPRVVLEAGGNSAWVQAELEARGCEVWVVASTTLSSAGGGRPRRKNDREDARRLWQLSVATPKMLVRVRHRGAQEQADLTLLRSRDHLVGMRTGAINHVRGTARSVGISLPRRSSESFTSWTPEQWETVPESMRGVFEAHLRIIAMLTEQIAAMDREVKRVARERYPVVERLQQPHGVGPVISLAYVLTIADPHRFRKSRAVGPYLGLAPGQYQSGDLDPQLGIDKRGDSFLRRLLVQGAHCILGPKGPPSDLRAFGERLCARGGTRAKKRAVVAVARKLAVLLHRLWVSGETYEPNRQRPAAELVA